MKTIIKKFINHLFFLSLLHVLLCLVSQAASINLSYRLSDLKARQSLLVRKNQDLTLRYGRTASLKNIYPKITRNYKTEIDRQLDLTRPASYAYKQR